MSPRAVHLIILRALERNQPYATPFEGLLEEVNAHVRPALTADQLLAILRRLLDALYVDFIADAIEPDNQSARRWVLKEAGEALLKK